MTSLPMPENETISVQAQPITTLILPPVYMGGMFSDNSLVYYKPKSLSSGTGSVRNCRVKGRRT